MNGRYRRSLVVLVLLSMLPGSALGASLASGTIEYQPSLSFAHDAYSYKGTAILTTTTLDVNGALGYCLSEMFEAEAGLIIQHSSIDDHSGFGTVANTGYGGTLGLTANLATSSAAIPFLSLDTGVLAYSGDGYTNAETSVLAPAVTAGVRWMIKSSASVNFTLTYEHILNATGSKNVDGNSVLLGIGVSLFAGP